MYASLLKEFMRNLVFNFKFLKTQEKNCHEYVSKKKTKKLENFKCLQ